MIHSPHPSAPERPRSIGRVTAARRACRLSLLGFACLQLNLLSGADKVDFSHQILPILKESCLSCHGEQKQKGKLRLDQKTAALAGGKNGRVILPGKAEDSSLYRRLLLSRDDDERMPNEGDPLPQSKLDLIRDWINQGALWPEAAPEIAGGQTNRAVLRKRTDLEISDAELLPADRPIGSVIDHYLEARQAEAGIHAAPEADDATVVRRLTLDLAGRIPTPEEAEGYFNSVDSAKRATLVDRLIRSPWFYRHLASELAAMLRGADGTGPDVRDYLLGAMKENRPWLRVYRELLGEGMETSGPERFVIKRLNDPDLLTRDISSMMFGINLSCCQCHTHPYVDTLTQDYFLGTKNFFARCYEFQGTLREKQFGPAKVEFKTKSGRTAQVGLKFINGAVVEAPQPNVPDLTKAIQDETKRIEDLKKNFEKTKEFPPEAFFSLRREFVRTSEQPENLMLLARSIVNRLWYRYYGYGLVMLVDQMHAQNPPSHPELLRWLARDLMAHDWDLRRLIAGLVSSRAYSRSSRWEQAGSPSQNLFAVANLRPLTPMQFGMSVLVLGEPELGGTNLPAEALEKRVIALENGALTNFSAIIDLPREGFQIDMEEPLGMSNDADRLKRIAEMLTPRLRKLSTRENQIRSAVWSIFGRPAKLDEVNLLSQYLERHSTVAENERAGAAAMAISQIQAMDQAKSRAEVLQRELQSLSLVSTPELTEAVLPPPATASTLKEPSPSGVGDRAETPAKLRTEATTTVTENERLHAELNELLSIARKPSPVVPRSITSSAALEQLVWSLIGSAEFRFNH